MSATPEPAHAVGWLVRWPIAALLSMSAALYVFGLQTSPPYFGGDEAHFAVHSYAIAQDGRDLNGAFLPLFVNLWDPLADQRETNLTKRWYQPVLFYVTALWLSVAPLSEFNVRLPMALIAGVLSPWLLYRVAWRILKRRDAALLAALLLAWSPSNLILGRQALDYLMPLPFVLGWLWCLTVYVEQGGRRLPLIGGLLLGVGFFSYIAAWIFMPLCVALGIVAYHRDRKDDWRRPSLTSVTGFVIPLVAAVPWLLMNPAMLHDTFSRYQAPDGVSLALPTITAPFWNYASLLNPWLLFVSGGPVPTTSLGRAGVFLLPVAALFPIGVVSLLRRGRPTGLVMVLLAGAVLAPVPAIAAGEPQMIQRAMFLLPFVILIACAGFIWLRASAALVPRLAAMVVLGALPLQFAYVYRDYLTHYQLRSAFYYDPVAFGEVAEFLIDAAESSDVPEIYLSRDLDDPGVKWRFYTTKRDRQDLLHRTQYVDVDAPELSSAPAGSLLVIYDQTVPLTALLDSNRWRLARVVRDIDNRTAALILRSTTAP